jgi:hypothetical protein
MTASRLVFFSSIVAAAMGTFTLTLYLYIGPLSERATRAEARLEAMRTGIRDGAYPHPIGCARFQGAPWEGFVSLGDTWPKDEPRPMVCHLKFEVERLGLVPKGQI